MLFSLLFSTAFADVYIDEQPKIITIENEMVAVKTVKAGVVARIASQAEIDKLNQKNKEHFIVLKKEKPKVLLTPIEADFSAYGIKDEDKTKLVSIKEFEKKHAKEKQELIEKRKKDEFEQHRSYKETIDDFFK